MTKGFSIQSSFSSGEISPLLHARPENSIYQTGCEITENLISDSHGPLRSRQGFEFLDDIIDQRNIVIKTFQFTANLPLALVFVDQGSRIYAPEGPLIPATINRITNPRFHDGLTGWTVSQLGSDSIVTFEKDLVTINTASDIITIVQPFVVVSGVTVYRLRIHMTTAGKRYRVLLGTTSGGGEILNVITSNDHFFIDFTSGSDNLFLTIRFDSVGGQTSEGQFKLHYSEVISQSPTADNGYEFNTPYLSEDIELLRFAEAPDGSAIYVFHPDYPQSSFRYDKATDVWTYGVDTFTDPPVEWAVGNYPSMGVVYENRLWMGATRKEQSTMWASKTNEFTVFTIGTNDDDPFNFTLQNNEQIMWALATKDLVLGASHSELIVTSSSGAVTQSDIQVQQQSAYGSASQSALLLGDQIIYISLDRRKLRVIQYEFSADNWLSTDLTFPSEHITKGEILTMSWQQDPDNLLWCLLRDGTMACLTYDRSNNIYGWHRHFTDGAVLALGAGGYIGGSVLYSAIKRRSGIVNMELLAGTFTLDSSVELSAPTPVTGFSGINHLIGDTVHVFTDDAVRVDAGGPSELVYHGTQVVAAAGVVSVPTLHYRMVVGLMFRSKFKSLTFDQGSIGGGNTGRTHTKRWTKLFIELNESARPLINGVRPPTRTAPTMMNVSESIKTERVQVALLGFDKVAQITVEQDLPFPLIVLAAFGEITQDNL